MNEIDQIAAIKKALAVLRPTTLEIIDDSHKHAGHGGWRAGTVTHIHVKIATPDLEGQTRLTQHRAVTDALKPFMDKDYLHAVRITIISCK